MEGLFYSILQSFARAELRQRGSSNRDFLAGRRVTALAGFALSGREGTKTHEGDFVTLSQGSTSSDLFISNFLLHCYPVGGMNFF